LNALIFAWRSLLRQPARTALGVLGVAAVGALLFDMLLLSNGLVLSMRALFDRSGFEVRVMASHALPGTGPPLTDAAAIAARLTTLPEVDEAIALRFAAGEIDMPFDPARETESAPGRPLDSADSTSSASAAGKASAPDDGTSDAAARGPRKGLPLAVTLLGADRSSRKEWTIFRGRDLTPADSTTGEVVINDALAAATGRGPGDTVTVRALCQSALSALPPATFRIAGVAHFPFDSVTQMTAAMSRLDIVRACGDQTGDTADLILVAAADGFDAQQTSDAVTAAVPALAVMTNAEVVGRIDASGFSYFRQISAVLSTITGAFGFLLITVLLTVSVNQRLGTIAALRAIGLSRRRVVADVLCESALLVGAGGLLALPLGFALAVWLDRVLTRIPGLPHDLHFFVFEPRALGLYVVILVLTAVLAAVYPIRLVARLPIAATLRDEVIS
jgi:putative ABC transport system permease protein